MNYIKLAEQQLKNYNETVSLTEILPQILQKNIIELQTIEKVLQAMESRDREIIQRICINGENPKDLETELGIRRSWIYKKKNKALESFAKRLYGIDRSGGKCIIKEE